MRQMNVQKYTTSKTIKKVRVIRKYPAPTKIRNEKIHEIM